MENEQKQPVENKRTLNDVQQEYARVCSQAGDAQYKISRMQTDLALLNKRLLDLNLEAGKLAAEEARKEAEKRVEEANKASNEAKVDESKGSEAQQEGDGAKVVDIESKTGKRQRRK